MSLTKLSELKLLLDKKPVKRLVLAAAHDSQSLGAVLKAAADRIVEPTLIGDEEEIKKLAREGNYKLEGLKLINEPVIEKTSEIAVKMVHNGEADILMKGKVGTSTLLRHVLNKSWGLRTGNLLSHFAVFEVKTYHKLIAVTDVAMKREGMV